MGEGWKRACKAAEATRKPAKSQLAEKIIKHLKLYEILINPTPNSGWIRSGKIELSTANRIIRRVIAEHERKRK